MLAFAAVHPVLGMGFNDDWQYILMSRWLADMGAVKYDGWTGPLAIPHVMLGATVIKVFGFSFLGLRTSILPLWIMSGLLVYLLGRRIGLTSEYGAFASLTVTMCPLVVYTGASFTTEVPALTLILFSTYMALRAITDEQIWRIQVWLSGAAVMGELAGMVREVYWPASAWMITVAVFFRWSRRSVRWLGILLMGGMIAVAIVSTVWHYAQPNAVREVWSWGGLVPADTLNAIGCGLRLVLKTVLMCLPAVFCVVVAVFSHRLLPPITAMIIAAGLITGAAATTGTQRDWLMAPWIGNLVTQFGGLPPNHDALGDKPTIISHPIRLALGICVFAGLMIWVHAAHHIATEHSESIVERLRTGFAERNSFVAFLMMTVPFAAAYIGLISLRDLFMPIFDRYLVPIIAFTVLYGTWSAVRIGGAKPPVAAWILLVGVASFGIAVPHDAYAQDRARLAVATSLTEQGIPRHCISAGYEYDGWTQVTEQGTTVPPKPDAPPVIFWFLERTPAVTPCYFVTLSRQPNLGEVIQRVEYSTWLPPRRRVVLAQRVPKPCLAACARKW